MIIILLFLFLFSNANSQQCIVNDCAFRSIVKDSVYHEFEEHFENGNWRIYKRISKDGIHFSDRIGPLLSLGDSTGFDAHGQADPTVVKDTIWRMWYDAMNKDGIWDSLGYAISGDGLKWIKQGSILGRSGGSSKSIHHPVVINYNKIFYMFYSGAAIGDKYIVKNIFLAISFDGIHFLKKTEPVIRAGESLVDSHYIRPARPYKVNNIWYMNCWVYDGNKRKIMTAISFNLLNWYRGDCTVTEGDPTASDVIVNEDQIQMWYTTFTSEGNFLYYKSEKY